jgi:hypothetical protein
VKPNATIATTSSSDTLSLQSLLRILSKNQTFSNSYIGCLTAILIFHFATHSLTLPLSLLNYYTRFSKMRSISATAAVVFATAATLCVATPASYCAKGHSHAAGCPDADNRSDYDICLDAFKGLSTVWGFWDVEWAFPRPETSEFVFLLQFAV